MKTLIILMCVLCTAFTAYVPGMFSISSDVQELAIGGNSATVYITEYTNSNAGYEVYVYSIYGWSIPYFTYDGIEFHNPTGKILLTDSIHRTPATGLKKEFTIYLEGVEGHRDQLVFNIVAK